jgi:hypothetical protein
MTTVARSRETVGRTAASARRNLGACHRGSLRRRRLRLAGRLHRDLLGRLRAEAGDARLEGGATRLDTLELPGPPPLHLGGSLVSLGLLHLAPPPGLELARLDETSLQPSKATRLLLRLLGHRALRVPAAGLGAWEAGPRIGAVPFESRPRPPVRSCFAGIIGTLPAAPSMPCSAGVPGP